MIGLSSNPARRWSGNDKMIPYFPPVVLRVGRFSVHLFGVLVAIGVFLGVVQLLRRGRQLGQSEGDSTSMATWSILMGFAVAHVADVIAYHPERLIDRPIKEAVMVLLNPSLGISSLGGFLGGTLGIWAWSLRHRASVMVQVDSMLFGLATGWFFGRMGCFAAHDHPGLPSNFFLAVDFGPGAYSGRRHDLGLYEALFALLLALLFQWLAQKPRPLGLYAALATTLYAPVRFALDFLRVDDKRYLGLTPGQYGCAVVLVVGLRLITRIPKTQPASGPASTP